MREKFERHRQAIRKNSHSNSTANTVKQKKEAHQQHNNTQRSMSLNKSTQPLQKRLA